MLCPNCQFQNPERAAICSNCKKSLSRRRFNFWEIGFFIELFLLVLLVVLVVVLTIDNLDLKLKVSTAMPQISQPSPTTSVYPKIASWKTYTNLNLGITFQYPDDWVLSDEPDKEGVSTGLQVAVDRHDEKCGEKNDLSECENYGFYIERDDSYSSRPLPTDNANLYILESTLEVEKRLDKCIRDTNTLCWGERAIPGLEYLGKEERLFSDQTLFPAAEISTMPRMQGSRYQYYIIKNKRLYLIEVLVPDSQTVANKPWFIDKNHPIIKIIKTLKFL